jgi:hypothetical protein
VRRLLVLFAVAGVAAVAASSAAATNECRGLMICVPVAGPWVVATPARTEFQLSCPKNYIVAGLDAELSSRGIDIGFVGALGSPVNPGITTAREAVFLGRLVRGPSASTFRPHIGCVPASGGGRRTPTAYHAYPPGKPTVRHVLQVRVNGGSATRTARCARNERLVSASHAVGFFGATPPGAALVRRVRASHRIHNGVATVKVSAAEGVAAVVQLDIVCVPR